TSGGQIVLAGGGGSAGVFLAAFGPDGSPSLTFGSGGIATTPGTAYSGGSYAVLAMPDGTYVVGGSIGAGGDQQPALWRFNADGSLDTAFGSGGLALGPVGDFGYGQVVLAPNGDIVQEGQGGVSDDGSLHPPSVSFYRN